MAEDAPERDTSKKDLKVEAPDIESQIQTAMSSRVAHFKEQAEYFLLLSPLCCLIGFQFEYILRRNICYIFTWKILYTM